MFQCFPLLLKKLWPCSYFQSQVGPFTTTRIWLRIWILVAGWENANTPHPEHAYSVRIRQRPGKTCKNHAERRDIDDESAYQSNPIIQVWSPHIRNSNCYLMNRRSTTGSGRAADITGRGYTGYRESVTTTSRDLPFAVAVGRLRLRHCFLYSRCSARTVSWLLLC